MIIILPGKSYSSLSFQLRTHFRGIVHAGHNNWCVVLPIDVLNKLYQADMCLLTCCPFLLLKVDLASLISWW